MKHPMFYFIHKLNRSVFSIKDFNPDKKNFYSTPRAKG